MTEESAAFDRVLELCADPHRRIVLAVLASQRRSLTLQDLTKAVVEHSHRRTPEEVGGEVLERIHLSLHHHHVPKLAAGGLVEYDATRRRVEPTDRLARWDDTISAVVDVDPALEPPVEP